MSTILCPHCVKLHLVPGLQDVSSNTRPQRYFRQGWDQPGAWDARLLEMCPVTIFMVQPCGSPTSCGTPALKACWCSRQASRVVGEGGSFISLHPATPFQGAEQQELLGVLWGWGCTAHMRALALAHCAGVRPGDKGAAPVPLKHSPVLPALTAWCTQ